jgi:hypothetical protein
MYIPLFHNCHAVIFAEVFQIFNYRILPGHEPKYPFNYKKLSFKKLCICKKPRSSVEAREVICKAGHSAVHEIDNAIGILPAE